MRLQPKIIIGILTILLTCIVTACSIFLTEEQKRLEQEIRSQGTALATLVANFSATPIQRFSFFILHDVARNVEQTEGVSYCEIYDTSGNSLVEVDVTIHGKKITKESKIENADILIIDAPIIKDTTLLGRVEIGLELSPVKEKLHDYIFTFLLGIVVIITVVGFSISFFLSYNFILPVVNLSGTAQKIAKGDFVKTGITSRSDEIGELAMSFDVMSNNLQQLYRDLEKKVDERTSDLARINRQLENEIQVRMQAENELQTAKEAAEQATHYKSNFVANMSHEIRTPLNAILGYAQILQSQSGLDGQVRKSIKAIDRAGSHLLALINDILDLSKIEAGRMEVKTTNFDLSQLIRNITSMFQLRCVEKNLHWQVTGISYDTLLAVQGDAGKLRQILINLLGNAVKFTNAGTVTLDVYRQENGYYRFSVNDTGPGIPDDAKTSILEPFSDLSNSNNTEGSGLGLSITSKFLELMDSNLEIFDNVPHGSSFCFNLHLPDGDENELHQQTTSEQTLGIESEKQLTALIVDDDPLSRAMLVHLLNKTGITTEEAQNGIEALGKLATHIPDIIFMDRYMPEMDGTETIVAIKKQYGPSTPPIVMITAAAFDSVNETKKQLGIDGLIIKPCDIKQVIEVTADLLQLNLKVDDQPPTGSPSEEKEVNTTDFSTIILPAYLREQLVIAVEFGEISHLKQLLNEAEDSGDIDQTFLKKLKDLLNKYDMDSILTLLATTTESQN